MATTITTKYGTRINVTGLSPQQVARVRSIAEDKGAYGAKGAALAETLRKQSLSSGAPTSRGSDNSAPPGPGSGTTPSGDPASGASQSGTSQSGTSQSGNPASGPPASGPPENPNPAPTPAPEPPAERKTITTKYGTTIDVTGLNPKQVERVRSVAEDKGKYGTKGRALAETLRKQAIASGAPTSGGSDSNEPYDPSKGAPTDPAPGPSSAPPTPAFDPGLGEFHGKRRGAFEDPNALFNAAPKIPGAQDLIGEIGKVRDANYAYLSRDFARNKQQEITDTEQDLADRGIPFDPNPNSLYGKTMAQLQTRYGDMDSQARQQSIIGGDNSFSTLVGAGKTANDAFYQGIFGLTDAELTKYGIDKDVAVKLKQIQAAKEAARQRGSGTPPPPEDKSPLIGGIAPG